MLKNIASQMWAFDLEWVPDVDSGRRVYDLPAGWSDEAVMVEMWRRGGATPEEPQPYLKTVLCRVVSVAAVIRKCLPNGKVELRLWSLPEARAVTGEPVTAIEEADLIRRFLEGVGRNKPQLVGFNSQQSDLLILVQRALTHRLSLPDFCARPNKPWEGVDYFSRGSDFNIDLRDALSGFGKTAATLHELATAARIPGKLDTSGDQVVQLWREGKIEKILQYNECDALTTYLLWLRLALLSGLLDEDAYQSEKKLLLHLLESRSPHAPHLNSYLQKWQALGVRHVPT